MNDSILQQRQKVQELLESSQSIGVILPQNQTMDAVAAALSIALILQDSGKNSQIVSLKEPIVEFSSLVGIDQIKSSFSGSTKTLTVSFPYKEGEIEKVSYNIEGDRLNVNLFAESSGINFSDKDIRFIRQGSAPSLIITIGIRDLQEVAEIIDPSSARIINIDNNVSNSLFGDLVFVDSAYSSISEIIAKLANALNLQIEFDVAQNLLDGIMYSTQNFSSPKTSPLAFEIAGFLMQKGAIRRIQKVDWGRHTDTSLQMLGEKPQDFPKQHSQKSGQKPLNSTPFGNAQDKHGKQFIHQQNKQFGFQNFPKQNPFKKQQFVGKQYKQMTNPLDTQDSFQEETSFKTQNRDFLANSEDIDKKNRVEEIKSQLHNIPVSQMPEEPQIPSEDQAPSDWFTPKSSRVIRTNDEIDLEKGEVINSLHE